MGAWWTAQSAHAAKWLQTILVLDTGQRWGDILLPWQERVHAGILGIPGSGMETKPLTWCDGPTGCGKDQQIAAAVLSILHYAPAGFRGVMLSTDHDRARDVIESLNGFLRRDRDEEAGIRWRRSQGLHEGWIGQGIEFTRDQIRSTSESGRDVVVKCVATDGASASGERADLFIANEVQSWADPHGGRVWTETFARFQKKAHGRLSVLSNLPFTGKGDWRRDAWEQARTGTLWNYIPARLADCPWITEERLAIQRATLPATAYRRLYNCEPTDGRGELIEAGWYDAAVRDMLPALEPKLPGRRVVGCDLGISRDHAVVIMLRLDLTGAVYLEKLDVWVPRDGNEVPLAEVKDRLRTYGKDWGAELLLDPFQAKLMAQDLLAEGLTVETIDATQKNASDQTLAVVNLFREGRLRVWKDAGKTEIGEGFSTSLRQQLLDAEVKEANRGVYKVVQKRSRAGHGDQVSALMLAAFGIVRIGAWSEPCAISSSQIVAKGEERARPTRPQLRYIHGDHGRSNRYRYERRHSWRAS